MERLWEIIIVNEWQSSSVIMELGETNQTKSHYILAINFNQRIQRMGKRPRWSGGNHMGTEFLQNGCKIVRECLHAAITRRKLQVGQRSIASMDHYKTIKASCACCLPAGQTVM